MRFLRVFDSLKIVRAIFVALFAIFAFAPAHTATLPAGYTELEYLESTGTQWIDTGYKPNAQNVKYAYGVQGTNAQKTSEMHPARIADGRIQIYRKDGHWSIYESSPSVSSSQIQNLNALDKVDFVVENNYDNSLAIWANNINVTRNYTTRSNTYTTDITLFTYTSSTTKFVGRIYYFKVYENGILRFNAVPVRHDSDGVLGMYDLMDSNPETAFHTNAGTGTFIAGEYKIKIATTKYNEAEFAPVETDLNAARTVINNLITQMQTNAINVSKLAVEKQTRPNADCPAGKNCLLVTDPTGAENWYVIAGADDVETAPTTPDYFSFTVDPYATSYYGDNNEMIEDIQFAFDMTPSGTFTIDWGDGSEPQVINRPTVTDLYDSASRYSHSYTTGGNKTIKITGRATGYSSSGPVIIFNDYELGNESYAFVMAIDGSLGAIFPTLGNGAGQQPRFSGTFASTQITSIPAGLFRGVTGAADAMFESTFYGTRITSIPENLFSGITDAAEYMFCNTFSGTKITSIPAGLFSGITDAANRMFESTFFGCSNLTGYIPESTFAGLIQNNSPDNTNFMTNIFNNSTGLATACPQNTTEVSTPYKSAYWSTGNGNAVMCRPN